LADLGRNRRETTGRRGCDNLGIIIASRHTVDLNLIQMEIGVAQRHHTQSTCNDRYGQLHDSGVSIGPTDRTAAVVFVDRHPEAGCICALNAERTQPIAVIWLIDAIEQPHLVKQMRCAEIDHPPGLLLEVGVALRLAGDVATDRSGSIFRGCGAARPLRDRTLIRMLAERYIGQL